MSYSAIKFSPCPFCGWLNAKCNVQRRGDYSREGDNYQVVCNKCRARWPLIKDNAQAACDAWNRIVVREAA